MCLKAGGLGSKKVCRRVDKQGWDLRARHLPGAADKCNGGCRSSLWKLKIKYASSK